MTTIKKAKKRTTKTRTTKAVRQTGTSKRSIDILHRAKAPGARRAKSGKTYSERRRNRSDKKGKRV